MVEITGEEKYEVYFRLIAAAGTSKSESMEAIQEARTGNYEGATELLTQAEKDMREAHSIHFELLQKEAGGEQVEMNLIAVHAQDHLTMATVTHDMAVEITELYRIIKNEISR